MTAPQAPETGTETPPPAPSPAPETGPTETTDWKAEAEKWKALSRKNEEQAKGRAELEKQLAELTPLKQQVEGLAPLKALAEALGVKPDKGKTDVETLTERIAAQEKRAADAELRAIRLEVAAEKQLTPAQAARLQGSTREELAADADALKALFPAPAAPAGGDPNVTTGTTPTTPAPDPSQGARGGVNELQALLAEAQKAGKTREVIRLKTLISAQQVK